MRQWWLSFCDAHRPTGQQFLGACVVWAFDIAGACRVAWALGCNPGGEVAFLEVPYLRTVGPEWCERLLDRAECDALDEWLTEAYGPWPDD